jgi:hypothetical protein
MVLSACGPPADTTIPEPPQSSAFTSSSNTKLNTLIERWKQSAPESMRVDGVKPESIEERVYVSSASLQEIADFYRGLTQKGWHALPRMPGLQSGILLAGYEIGTTALVVGAFDATQYGQNGVIVYTLKGTK